VGWLLEEVGAGAGEGEGRGAGSRKKRRWVFIACVRRG